MKIVVSTKVLIYCAILGVILIASGVILGFRVFPDIVTRKVWENAVIRENTSQWEMFKKIPFPFDIKIYFFDVQNRDEIMRGRKPRVKEIGPYVYTLHRWRDDIEWSPDNFEISFYDYSRFDFNQEASGTLSDEDMVTILNSPYNAFLLTVEETTPGILESLNDFLPDIFGPYNDLFMTARVKDLLFEGTTICPDGGGPEFGPKAVCSSFRAKAKEAKTMEIVGKSISYAYLRFKNDTHLGRFTIKSGQDVKEDFSSLVAYENRTNISVWTGDPKWGCNKIGGTTAFRPYVTPNYTFTVFGEDICRKLDMTFNGTETVNDITGYKFSTRNSSFDAPKEDSDNFCYCVNRSRTLDGGFGCLKDGLLDMTNCVGAPVLLSFPHLLFADREYLDSLDGLSPNASLHDTFVILEPISGTPLKMAKRVQFNMFIRPIDDIYVMENITNALVPMFWIEESMTLKDDYTNLLKKNLFLAIKILDVVKWTLVVVGLIALVVPLVAYMYSK